MRLGGGPGERLSIWKWERGREEKLIEVLNGGVGQGYAAWRVLLAPEEWERIVRDGLARKQLVF